MFLGHHHLAIILAVTSAAFALVLAISTTAFLTRKKILKKRKGTKFQLEILIASISRH